MKTFYRRRVTSDTWHYHVLCRWWPKLKDKYVCKDKKPSSGELCNQCRAKARADK